MSLKGKYMEKIALYHDDCLNVLRNLEAEIVDLTVTSPPYDQLRAYNGGVAQWNYRKFQAIAQEMFRVTVRGGVVVWIVNDSTIRGGETGTSFRQALWFKECGFTLHDTMIWQKISPFQHKNRYIQAFDYMFVLSKGAPKTVNLIQDRKNKWGGTKIHGTERQKDGSTKPLSSVQKAKTVKEYGARLNIWDITPNKANRTGHPAVFPEQLASDHIRTWSNEGDTVLDCFMGSGTTGVSCQKNNRCFIGIEIDETYFDIAQARLFGEML